MAKLLFGIFRDLYVVLAVMLMLEQVLGGDLLHDMTRKAVITITVCVAAFKFFSHMVLGSAPGPASKGPVRRKKTECGKNALLEWATSEMQGWRPAMEDATRVVVFLPEPLEDQALFAVFDGHGGSQVSTIASNQFPKVLTACVDRLLKTPSSDEGLEQDSEPDAASAEAVADSSAKKTRNTSPLSQKLCCKALQEATLALDKLIRQAGAGLASKATCSGPLSIMANLAETPETRNAFNLVGTTAVVALLDCGPSTNGESGGSGSSTRRPRRIAVANCGDSRAILCRAGTAIELSEDHKPELPGEEARIRKAGGHVAQAGPCHRVDGWGLNLSRALGDFHYKARADLPPEQQKVCAVAEIRTLELTSDDEFLVLACDGCFELNDSQGVVDIVRGALRAGMSIEQAAEELVDRSCSSNLAKTRGRGGDNCSSIVVSLKSIIKVDWAKVEQ